MRNFILVFLTIICFNSFSQTIFNACYNQDLKKIKKYVEIIEVDINATNENGQTPLIISINNNNLDIAKYLLDNGANIDVSNRYGSYIGYGGNSKTIEFLIFNGFDVNRKYEIPKIIKGEWLPIEFSFMKLFNIYLDIDNKKEICNVIKILYEHTDLSKLSPDVKNYPMFKSINNDVEGIKKSIRDGNNMDGVIYYAVLSESVEVLNLFVMLGVITLEYIPNLPNYDINEKNIKELIDRYKLEKVRKLLNSPK